ncbi:sigma 54-interacting transcriptional regulator, partial [Bacillus mycoides]|uniref:sigma 54-interacting transcriptional regulator n=1 Tax=Bacillus mycoides TaxID=1405 RepID=UPI003CC7E127
MEQPNLGANTPATVFLPAQSATRKDLFPHPIHNPTNPKYNNFLPLNSPPISQTLLQTQFFPYQQPPFSPPKTGAKPGFFEQANNPSIFLH